MDSSLWPKHAAVEAETQSPDQDRADRVRIATAAIVRLADALAKRNTMPWVVTYVAPGYDPLPAMWSLCSDDVAMLRVLYRLPTTQERQNAFGIVGGLLREHGCGYSSCRRCADAIRSQCPRVTLDDVLSAVSRR